MATTKTEKHETAATSAAAKPRKPRVPKTLTPLEAQVVASLAEQKTVTRALRGVAKAVANLSPAKAQHVLTTALESLENLPPSEPTGS